MPKNRDYAEKRTFETTPEPQPETSGDVDPLKASPGPTFVIHQHHARRLHFDLRLEMLNNGVPVLVSWAIPKNLPRAKGERHLAIHVEDHPFEYGTFSGSIPKGNYGAGEVRIFDEGTYEIVDRTRDKISFRLEGKRLRAIFHLVLTKGYGRDGGKEKWLALMGEDLRPPPDAIPGLHPMTCGGSSEPFDHPDWLFEPQAGGLRTFAVCTDETVWSPELPIQESPKKIHEQIVGLDAVLDGEVIEHSGSFTYSVSDIIYLDGSTLTGRPLDERKRLLVESIVPNDSIQIAPYVADKGTDLAAAMRTKGLTKLIGKRSDSLYEVGTASESWVEIDL